MAFSPDGESVLHGTNTLDAMVWHFPEPPVPAPAWLPELLESLAGLRVAGSNAAEPVPFTRWLELRDRLQSVPGDDFYARWAREYCGEPAK